MEAEKAIRIVKECEENLKARFQKLDDTALLNQKKVLDAFIKCGVQARHLFGTTGYGYDDEGRDILCRLYAEALGAESALVSPNIASGTHAITLMLFGVLRPGDKLISVSGMPYDTLTDVIEGKDKGSLADFGIKFEAVELLEGENFEPEFDYKAISELLKTDIKAVFVGRSRGYEMRNAISVEKIAKLCAFCKKNSPNTLILVDNCYGEFVEALEPTVIGADLIAGSLIKNVGGGLAPTGGYVAGKAELVEQVSYRLTAPSVGNEVGSNIAGYLPYYQGLFLAPSVVRNALKSAFLFSSVYRKLGFFTLPDPSGEAFDIITSIKFDDADRLISFCEAVQEASPIDGNVVPVPWDMPGYRYQVIMAAGTFVQGASIELSADSPIKPPFVAYVQGGLTYEHAKLAVLHTLQRF